MNKNLTTIARAFAPAFREVDGLEEQGAFTAEQAVKSRMILSHTMINVMRCFSDNTPDCDEERDARAEAERPTQQENEQQEVTTQTLETIKDAFHTAVNDLDSRHADNMYGLYEIWQYEIGWLSNNIQDSLEETNIALPAFWAEANMVIRNALGKTFDQQANMVETTEGRGIGILFTINVRDIDIVASAFAANLITRLRERAEQDQA